MYDPTQDPDLQPLTPTPQQPEPNPGVLPQQMSPQTPPDQLIAQPVSMTPATPQPEAQPVTQPALNQSPAANAVQDWQSAVVASEATAMDLAPATTSSKKKPLIIGAAAMLVLVLLGAGWMLGGRNLLNSNGGRTVADEASNEVLEEQLLTSAQNGTSDAESGSTDETSTQSTASESAKAAVTAKAAGSESVKISGYSIKCSVASSQKSEISATVKKQVERAIRVSYEGKLADHVSWVPPSVVKKIRNKNNQPKDVQKVFASIKPKSCEIIGSLKPDQKGEIIGVMVRYKSAKTGATYQNSIMVVTADDFAATLDVSKPEKI